MNRICVFCATTGLKSSLSSVSATGCQPLLRTLKTNPDKDMLKVDRKGNSDEKLGSVMVKISDEALKSRSLKKKKRSY